MSKHGAEIGDTVRVFWPNGERLDCTVKYMPQDVGDSWVVWSEDGTIYHIQQYETILVLNRKADIANATAQGRAVASTLQQIVGSSGSEAT